MTIRKRNGGIVIRDKRLADRWRRSEDRKKADAAVPDDMIRAILNSPGSGATKTPKNRDH